MKTKQTTYNNNVNNIFTIRLKLGKNQLEKNKTKKKYNKKTPSNKLQ